MVEFWREREMGRGWDWVFESCLGREPRVRSAVVDGTVVIPVREAIAVLLRVLVEDEDR